MGLISLLSPRLWLGVAIVLVLGLSALSANRAGRNAELVKSAQADLTAVRANANTARYQQTAVIKAQNDQTKRNQYQKMDIAGARVELDGLRNDIAAIRRDLPAASSSAGGEHTDTATQLLAECAASYQELASKADSHASDTLMYQQAWPK